MKYQMGEDDEQKSEWENKRKPTADGGEKSAAAEEAVEAVKVGEMGEAELVTVVLKLDLHCEGCAKIVRRSISHLQGVAKVKAELVARKLTVTGNVDPAWLRQTVQDKTRKKVELISPPPKTFASGGLAPVAAVAAAGGEMTAKKDEADAGNGKSREVAMNTMVMKIKLHCDGCAQKIKRIILKNVDGVSSVWTDFQKDLVTMVGTMDVKGLVTYLKEKLKRNVQIAPSSKNDDVQKKKEKEECGHNDGWDRVLGGDHENKGGKIKKDGEKSIDDDRKKKKKNKESINVEKKIDGGDRQSGPRNMGSGGGRDRKREVSRMDHSNHHVSQTHYAVPVYEQGYTSHRYENSSVYYQHYQDYSGSDWVGPYMSGPLLPPPTYLNAGDGMFSDENPNGCVVM